MGEELTDPALDQFLLAGEEQSLAIMFQLFELPKHQLRDLLVARLRAGTLDPARSRAEIETALGRLSHLAHVLVGVPRSCATPKEHLLRPPPTEQEGRQLARRIAADTNRAKEALARNDRREYKAIMVQLNRLGTPAVPPEEEDLDLARKVLTAYFECYRTWLDRDAWNGEAIEKSAAYDLIDKVVEGAGKRVRIGVALPLLRQLAAKLTDPHVREAVRRALEDWKYVDARGG